MAVKKRERILGPKREEGTGGWSKLHYEGLHNLYSSANIKSRRKGWAVIYHA
jgi:hypothetical protein